MTTTLRDEWIAKAEADHEAARVLALRRNNPLPDAVCFHCQQCAEKYLKAFLIAQNVVPPRTHNLRDLLNICATYNGTLATLIADLDTLNLYSVDTRYPGASATVAEAKDARAALRRVRKAMGLLSTP